MLLFRARRVERPVSPVRSPRQLRPLTVLFVVGVSVLGVAGSSRTERVAVAQAAGGVGCDSNPCIIWGLAGPNNLLKINTCTRTIVPAPLIGPAVQTIAAGLPSGLSYPNLQYGDLVGGLWCTSGFPPGPMSPCGAVAVGAHGLARDGTMLYAGSDLIPPGGCLHDPANLVGCGGFAFFINDGSDLVCDPSGRWGLMGEADVPAPGAGALYSISRANGAQLLPRPAGGRSTYSGLAYDRVNQLWGSNTTAGFFDLINPVTGIGASVFPIPIAIGSVWDLASDECFSCVEAGHDVGDAPDSTTHFPNTPMTAYPGVNAAFPSVIDPGTGLPPGPFHRLLGEDSWLGQDVTAEKDADLLPDNDLVTNIDPPGDLADRDVADAGVLLPLNLPSCQMTQFQYIITVLSGTRNRYTNVWMDFNRNGQWGEQLQCVDPITQQLVTVNE